jgi:hypothetical protein
MNNKKTKHRQVAGKYINKVVAEIRKIIAQNPEISPEELRSETMTWLANFEGEKYTQLGKALVYVFDHSHKYARTILDAPSVKS